jgi:cyanophycin synthetase
MNFRRIAALHGPNVWAKISVVEALVEMRSPAGALDESFQQRIAASLQELARISGKFERCPPLPEPSAAWESLAETFACVAIEMQNLAWLWQPVSFCAVRKTSETDVMLVALEFEEEALARASLEEARQFCLAAIHGEPFDLTDAIGRLYDVAYKNCLGSNTRPIAMAARAKGIPYLRLDDASLVQLGQGARQRRIQTACTDGTGAVAQEISTDKELTRQLLRMFGVPVPKGRPVSDAEDAWAAACELGTPVVVKPRNADYGKGVSLNLATQEQVAAAYAGARAIRSDVLVERFVPGHEHRFLVVGEQAVSVLRREPLGIVGDGRQTIAQLIEELNRSPLRGLHYMDPFDPVELDEADLITLAEQGFALGSIPPQGKRVAFRKTARGGSITDVTEQVHPETAARVVDAVRAVGLDVAGVDVVTPDVGLPLEDAGGAVIEVNAGPAMWEHLYPTSRPGRPVPEAIVDLLFPAGRESRIPVVAVAAERGNSTLARRIAHLLAATGQRVALACGAGVFLGKRRICAPPATRPAAYRAVFANPVADLAVLETDFESILHNGRGFDVCDVALLAEPVLGEHETSLRAARVLVEAVSPTGALVANADDAGAVALARYCRGRVIFYTADIVFAATTTARELGVPSDKVASQWETFVAM